MNQYSAFVLSLLNYLLRIFDIKNKTVALYNHLSLHVEHGINSLSTTFPKICLVQVECS